MQLTHRSFLWPKTDVKMLVSSSPIGFWSPMAASAQLINCDNRSQSRTRPFSAQALLVQSNHCCHRQLTRKPKVDARRFRDPASTLLAHWQPTSHDALRKLHHMCDNETRTSA
jgi:hypothetical protein